MNTETHIGRTRPKLYSIPEKRRLFATQRAAWAKRDSERWVSGFFAGLIVGLGGAVLAVALTLIIHGGFCK